MFDKHRDPLERHEAMVGVRARASGSRARSCHGFAAVVGLRGVYGRSERLPGRPKMDIAITTRAVDDAKQLMQSAMKERRRRQRPV